MRLNLYLILALFCLSATAFAQENFKKGQIVTLQGDTIHGFIDYKNWRRNPNEINFKEKENSKMVAYAPEDIHGFAVMGNGQMEIFRSRELPVSVDKRRINELGESSEPIFEIKNIFLFLYVQGKLNLYLYTDRWDNEHFFIEKDGHIEWLKYKLYYADSKVHETQTYKRQLVKYTQDCIGITQKEIADLKYDKGIIAIIKKYNACNGEASGYVFASEGKINAKFGLVAAMSTSYLNITGVRYPFKSAFKPSFDPALGLSMLLIIPRTNNRVGFYSELLYRQYKAENTTGNPYNTIDNSVITQASYTTNYIKLNTFFRYQLSLSQYEPYLNLGVSNALALSIVEKAIQKTVSYSDISTRDANYFKGSRKHELGLAFGLGGEIKRFGLELRGEMSNGFSDLTNVETRVSTIYTLIKYRF